MSTKVHVLFVAACLFVALQVSGAWEAKPCKGFKGKLHSLEIDNCPDKTGDYCEIELNDELSWHVKYTSGISYKKAFTGFQVEGHMSEADHCELQPDFCPGKEGEDGSYHFSFDLDMSFENKTGTLQLFSQPRMMDDDTTDYIVCAELPVKFLA